MQTQKDIQRLLAGLRRHPKKRLGQCFLVDGNLMRKLVDLASPTERETVLEIGPGTGSLTEEILVRARRVVAVEVDSDLAGLLRERFAGEKRLTLIEGDALESKHALAPAVLQALGERGHLVANLPYHIATPLIAECLIESWRSLHGDGVRLDRLTFTVQQELAERFVATEGRNFGPVSVVTALLGRVRLGPAVPASAFWPRPKVASRCVRIDFDAVSAGRLRDVALLQQVLNLAFTQRRKRIAALPRVRGAPFARDRFAAVLQSAGIDPSARPDHIPPEGYLALANVLAKGQ